MLSWIIRDVQYQKYSSTIQIANSKATKGAKNGECGRVCHERHIFFDFRNPFSSAKKQARRSDNDWWACQIIPIEVSANEIHTNL